MSIIHDGKTVNFQSDPTFVMNRLQKKNRCERELLHNFHIVARHKAQKKRLHLLIKISPRAKTTTLQKHQRGAKSEQPANSA